LAEKIVAQKIEPASLIRAFCLFFAGMILTASIFAAAPMQRSQAPGYFRIMLGNFEVTVLNDGTADLPVHELLSGMTPTAINAALAKSFLKSPLETSFNAFLINTGSKLVLVDSGAAGLFGPTLGKILESLKAAGYEPGQIDDIFLTHMHPDHVGGLVDNGKILFPNATVHVQKREADYWLSEANLEKADANMKGFFQGAVGAIKPYMSAGKLQIFDGDAELSPGITSQSGGGHTPGHTRYMIESQGQKILLVGDLIEVAAIQFDRPDVTMSFDSNGKRSAMERVQAFEAASTGGYLIGAAHMQFPGIGHIVKESGRYRWIPVNYTQMR
jgi:glyoxylase-like metal-dependent hydrolase (beta-lactamase superfamily II)